MDMVDTMCKFIQEEHQGNWELHLQAVSEMLPYFADSGHNNCMKSTHVFTAKVSSPGLASRSDQHFQASLHAVTRSDHHWAGLSSELIIDQVLIRSMKTSGGLTRVRDMTG